MRTLFFSTAIALAVVVACADKNPKPTGPGSDTTMTGSSTDTGSGSSMTAGSDSTMGSGSAMTGSGSAADTGSGSAMGSGSGAGSGSAVATDDGKDAFIALTKEEKIKIMKTEVVPAMGKAFKEHDKKKFAKFGCKTCHGKGVADGSYKMPNPGLPKLDFAALEAGKQEPKMAEFMAKVVKPELAKILKLEEYTEDNPKGFGCLHCHLMKK